jgi:hypothetical protein
MKCGNLAPAIPIAAMIVGAVLSAAPAMAFPVAGRFNGIIDQVSDPVGVIAGSGITIEPGTPFSGTIQYDTWPGGVSTDEDPNPNRGIYRFFVPEERPIPPDWVFGGFSLSIDGRLLSTNVSRDPVEIQVTNDLLSGGVLIDRFVFPINGFMRVLGSEPLPGLFPKGPLVLSQRGDGQPAGTPDLITSDALPTRIGFPAGTEGTLSMPRKVEPTRSASAEGSPVLTCGRRRKSCRFPCHRRSGFWAPGLPSSTRYALPGAGPPNP